MAWVHIEVTRWVILDRCSEEWAGMVFLRLHWMATLPDAPAFWAWRGLGVDESPRKGAKPFK